MRSVARLYVEDPEEYLAAVETAGSVTSSELNAIAATDTTILYQRVASPDTVAALGDADEELRDGTSFTGADVVFAAEAVDINGLDWLVVTSRISAELNESLNDFRRAGLIAVALFVVFITSLPSVGHAPCSGPSATSANGSAGVHENEPAEPVDIPKRSPTEFKTTRRQTSTA